MASIGGKALGEAAQSGGALARGFAALGYPKCLLIMLVSAALSVLLAIGLWYLLHWALFDWKKMVDTSFLPKELQKTN